MARGRMAFMARRTAALAVLATVWLAGCSADAVNEPEATLETPGAFVALSDDEGSYDILRTLSSIEVGSGQNVIFFTLFAPKAHTFDQAQELARDPELPVGDQLVLIPKSDVLARDWKVVWFRTLSEEERAILR